MAARLGLFALLVAACGATDIVLELRDWVVDYQRPTIDPRVAPYTMGADAKMGALLANNTFPGPVIDLVEGETLNVTVVNLMLADEAELVWEGVDTLASPKILAPQGGSGTYTLQGTKAGLYTWHAKSPLHGAAGLMGTISVRTAAAATALEQRTILLADARQRAGICFNALGQWDMQVCPGVEKATLNGQWGDGSSGWPLPVIDVKEGGCYSLQILGFSPPRTSSSLWSKFTFSVQDHTLQVAGQNMTSVTVDTKTSTALEATICADQHPIVDHDYSITYTYTVGSDSKSFSATLRYD